MIFNLAICYRFSNTFHKDLYEKYKQISENKNLEIAIYRNFYYIFRFGFELSFTGHDHAGPRFEFSFLGFNIDLKFYDSRHWDNQKGDWKIYN